MKILVTIALTVIIVQLSSIECQHPQYSFRCLENGNIVLFGLHEHSQLISYGDCTSETFATGRNYHRILKDCGQGEGDFTVNITVYDPDIDGSTKKPHNNNNTNAKDPLIGGHGTHSFTVTCESIPQEGINKTVVHVFEGKVKIKVRQKNSEGELQEMTCEMNEELAIFLNSPNGDPETKESIVKMIFDTQAPQVEQGPETPESVLHTAETEDSDQKVHIWSETEEKQLIALRTEMDDAFYKNKNHETLWQKIFENMNSAGIKVTKQQIMNKWRNLKRKYKETIDLNKKTGNEKHEFKYQNEFDNLFGHKASTKAAVSFDSGVNAEERKKKREIDKKATRPKKRSAENLLMKMENMNKEMREQMERHQEEKLRRFDRLLDIIEKQGQK